MSVKIRGRRLVLVRDTKFPTLLEQRLKLQVNISSKLVFIV